MVRSTDNGSLSIPPFLKKCYDMVDDKSTDTIISWSQNNDSFVIWDTTEFSVQLLPKYFKHSNFSSFIRQLNIYGFRKIDTDRWEFANDGFIRGQKHLLKNITRRKHSQGPDQKISAQQQENSVGPCEKDEKIANAGLWKEIESLKIGRNALMQELVKLRQLHETTDNKLLLLRDRLQGMEKNQQQMLSFLVMAMQNPGILAQLLHPKENNWRIAEASSMLEQGTEDAEPITSDGMIVKYQPPMDETPSHIPTPMTGSEKPQESDPSSDGMKDFFMNIDFMKQLMDENHAPFPFIPLDLPDDGAWEQLLDSPFLQNMEDAKLDGEGPVDSEMEMETTASGTQLEKSQNFELLLEQMEKSHEFGIQSTGHGAHLENSPNLEILTEQMGLLASVTNHKHGTQ